MPRRNITLSDEAYQALKRRKRSGESFSDLVLREFGQQGNAGKILAVLRGPNFPNEELAENVRQASKELRKNFKMREFDF